MRVSESETKEKKILFGAPSNEITKEMKINAWKEINEYVKSIGVFSQNKDWTYLRDVWWLNVRKLTTVSYCFSYLCCA